MKNKTVFDCFILMGTALSIRDGTHLPDMVRPLQQENLYTGTPINISLVIEEISIIDNKMLIEIDGILSQEWIDPRLGVNEFTRKLAMTGKIWEPKIVNINGKNLMEKDDDTVFWRGFGDEGIILLSKKIKLGIHCSRNLQNFPFDIQHCDLKFGSYRFPDDEISLVWDEAQVKFMSKPRTQDFIVLNVTKATAVEVRPSGNFSIASVKFVVKRNSTHYILCTGAPCIIMVLLDYISLWMELDKRRNVNLLSFSTTLYFYHTSLCIILPVSYFKASDIFVGMCTFFTFLSMLETFAVDSLTKLEEKYLHSGVNTTITSYKTCASKIYWLELGTKILFPVLYSLFVSFFGFSYM